MPEAEIFSCRREINLARMKFSAIASSETAAKRPGDDRARQEWALNDRQRWRPPL